MPMDFYELLQNHIALFLLMLTRNTGIFIISPFFGGMNTPVYFRAGLAFIMSLLLFPALDENARVSAPSSIFMYALWVLAELFVGWIIGFVAYLTLAAITMAGKVMDMQAGFAIVNVMDPTSGQQMPLIGSFLYNLAIIVFLVTNGHHMILSGLVESYRLVPIGDVNIADSNLPMIIVNYTAGIFLTGMKIAMPVTFAILLTNVGLGILARTMPQMNIFVVGIPMQIIVGIGVLMMLVPFYVMFLDVVFNEMFARISATLQELR